MALTESLRFLITSSSAQAQADLNKLGQSTTTAMTGIDKLKGAFGAGLGLGAGAGAVGAITSGLSQVATFAFSQAQQAVGAASDLQQAQGAVSAVFRDSASEVRAYGKEAAESVGLSNAAYQQQASVLGALLQNLGQTRQASAETSDQLIRVGADLAATFGGRTSDAVAAIGSALRGERDPIERYGISIKEANVQQEGLRLGLAATASELTDAQKATATLSLIQKQAANSAGAFARESDTLAGQQQRFNAELENARAELGEQLLPALTDLVAVGRDLIPVLGLVADVIGSMGAAAKAAFAPVEGLFGLVDDLVGNLGELPVVGDPFGESDNGAVAERIASLKTLFEEIDNGTRKVGELAPAFNALPPSIQAVILKLLGFKQAAAEAIGGARDVASLVKSIGTTGDTLFGATRAQDAFNKAVAANDTSGATKSAKDYEKALRSIADAERNLADAQAGLEEASINRFLTALGATSDEITSAEIRERDSTRSLADAKIRLIDAQERLNRLRNGGAAASRLEAQAAFLEAQKDLEEANIGGDPARLARAKAALLRAQQGLEDTSGAKQAQELERAQRDVEAAQDGVTQTAIDQRKAQRDLNDVLNRGKEGSRELRDADRELEDAKRRLETATYALDDAQDALIEGLNRTSSATKTASERFDSGVKSADSWLSTLVKNKATPDEFAKAVDEISLGLSSVATEAGKTAELDAYIGKIRELRDAYLEVSGVGKNLSAPAPKLGSAVGLSTTVGAGAGITQQITVQVDGRTIATAVVDESQRQGGLPIRIRASN